MIRSRRNIVTLTYSYLHCILQDGMRLMPHLQAHPRRIPGLWLNCTDLIGRLSCTDPLKPLLHALLPFARAGPRAWARQSSHAHATGNATLTALLAYDFAAAHTLFSAHVRMNYRARRLELLRTTVQHPLETVADHRCSGRLRTKPAHARGPLPHPPEQAGENFWIPGQCGSRGWQGAVLECAVSTCCAVSMRCAEHSRSCGSGQ